MLKNNAFKSFISVLFLLVGLFAWEKSASAALFDYNLDTDEILTSIDVSGLIYKNLSGSTLSITQLRYQLKDNAGNVHIETDRVNCADGTHIAWESNDSLDTNLNDAANFKEYTFNWSTPLLLTNGQCYVFYVWAASTDFLGGNDDYMEGYSYGHISGSDFIYENYLPYFKLFTGSASPSIEITNPPADVVINFTDFNYTFTATKDSLDTASAWLQLFWYDGATLSTVPQMTTQFDYPIGTTVATGNVNTFTPGNGTYEIRATIQDTSTGITDVATRTVIINIAGNPSNTLIASQSAAIDTYCAGISDTTTKYLCYAAKALFVPSNFTSDLLVYAKDSLLEEPPLSWGLAFSTAITGVNATNSAGFDVIPDFVDTFFAWAWWIMFLAACYHLGMHLFRT